MTDETKAKAQRFVREFHCNNVTLESLRSVLDKQGYTIVEFNNLHNDENVASLLSSLQLEAYAAHSKGFTYADANHRIVFVHEDLSDAEKLVILAHEEGHIYCGHFAHSPIIGKDVIEEHEANEFAHYILHPGKVNKAANSIKRHKIAWIISLICVLALLAGGIIYSVIQKENQYFGDYYITETGTKYHERDCPYIKDKTNVHRMTKEEFESGLYEPCGVCLADEETVDISPKGK